MTPLDDSKKSSEAEIGQAIAPAISTGVIEYRNPSPPPAMVIVCCRLLAIVMIAPAVQQSIYFIFAMMVWMTPARMAHSPFPLYALVTQGMTGLVWFLLAGTCWWRAPSVASRLLRDIPRDTSEPIFNRIPSDQLMAVLLIAVGVYEIAESLPPLVRGIALLQYQRSTPDDLCHLFSMIAQAAIGLWLILGTNGVMSMIHRHSGRWKDEHQSTDAVRDDPGISGK